MSRRKGTDMANTPGGRPPTLDALREAVAVLLDIPPDGIADDADLMQLGFDSLAMMRLVSQWRREGIRVSSRALAVEPTLASWTRQLDELRAKALTEEVGRSAGRHPRAAEET